MCSQSSRVRSARFELNYSSIPARLQLQVCSKSAWLRVLNASLNLSRPTLWNPESGLLLDLSLCESLILALSFFLVFVISLKRLKP